MRKSQRINSNELHLIAEQKGESQFIDNLWNMTQEVRESGVDLETQEEKIDRSLRETKDRMNCFQGQVNKFDDETFKRKILSLSKLLSTVREDCQKQMFDQPKVYRLLSVDNDFTWNVNIKSLFEKKVYQIDSEILKTCSAGYLIQFQLRVDRKKLHLSKIDFGCVLITGDYDSILFWPFSFPITVSVLNLRSTNHYSVTIDPKSDPDLFDRPNRNEKKYFYLDDFLDISTSTSEHANYIEDSKIFMRIHIGLDCIDSVN